MPRLESLTIRNYRSIEGPITISLPPNGPVVMIGENNAGKSNIVRALDMVLGHAWTGTHDPDDHEFYGRNRALEIEITAKFDREHLLADRYSEAIWTFNVARAGAASHNVAPSRDERRHTDYMSNDIKSTCLCVVVEADRNLNYQLSYSTRWTFLSKLMHAFHKTLVEDEDTRNELEHLFQEVKQRFERVQPYAEFVANLAEQLEGFAGTMTHRLEVDFQAYNPVNFFHALRLHAVEDGVPRTLAELGTGEQQILALSFAYAYATAFHQGIVLVVEEPEAHLHPLAQQWLARHMHELAAGGFQIVLTTHSPHFIDVESLDGLVLVRRTERGTTVRQLIKPDLVAHCVELGAPADRVTVDNIAPFYASMATPQILEGFFAKVVVLVEGPTEALTLPVYLERVGLTPAREGVAIVPVGGKGNLGKWHRLFAAYGIPTFVVFDNDGTQDDRRGLKRRDALAALGIAAEDHDAVLEAHGIEVRHQFMVFGRNFEEELRDQLAGYADAETAAETTGIDAKPFVAKWVAGSLDLDENPGWEAFRQFAAAVRALIPRAPGNAANPAAEREAARGNVARLAPRRLG